MFGISFQINLIIISKHKYKTDGSVEYTPHSLFYPPVVIDTDLNYEIRGEEDEEGKSKCHPNELQICKINTVIPKLIRPNTIHKTHKAKNKMAAKNPIIPSILSATLSKNWFTL